MFNLHLRKGYLLVEFNSSTATEEAFKKSTKDYVNTNGSNLEFFDERGSRVDISRFIQLDLVLTDYDVNRKTIRYRMTNIDSYSTLNLLARFKVRNSSSLLTRPSESARRLL